MYDHILIPTDGKKETLEAVQPGLELASQHGATVHILHVIERNLPLFSPRSLRYTAKVARQRAEDAVTDLQDLAEEYEVDSVTWVIRGRPVNDSQRAPDAIVEYAEANEIDLIVMGATSRGRLSRMLRPSVTHRVMSSTDIPVFGRRQPREKPYVSDRSTRVRSGSEFGD